MKIDEWRESTLAKIKETHPKLLMEKMEEWGLVETDVESLKSAAEMIAYNTADVETVKEWKEKVRKLYIPSSNEEVMESFSESVFYLAEYNEKAKAEFFEFWKDTILTIEKLPEKLLKDIEGFCYFGDSHRGEEVVPVRRFVVEEMLCIKGKMANAKIVEVLASPLCAWDDTRPYPEDSLEIYVAEEDTDPIFFPELLAQYK